MGWGYYSPFAVTFIGRCSFRRFLLAVDWLWTFNVLNEMSRLLHSLPSELRRRRVLLFVLLLAIKILNLCRSNLLMFCCAHGGLHVFDSFFPTHLATFYQLLSFGWHLRDGVSSRTSKDINYLYLRGSIFGILRNDWRFCSEQTTVFLHWNKRCAAFVLTNKTQFYRRPPMWIISFCYKYKLNDFSERNIYLLGDNRSCTSI